MFAIVRIRKGSKPSKPMQDTLTMLRITRINHCSIMPETATINGMLKKVQNFVTWGPITEKTLTALIAKRGRLVGDKRIPKNEAEPLAKQVLEKGFAAVPLKPVFRLSPPSKGYKSIKSLYPKGDAGFRGEKIEELLEKMM